jgi:hypothetical protein
MRRQKGSHAGVHDLSQLIDEAERETVDRLYWDFSSCPREELDECHAYEFARNVKSIHQDVAHLRKGKQQSFDRLFGALRKVVFAPLSGRRYALFWFYPEFPKQPYLSIPAKERCRRMKIAWPSDPRAAHAAGLSPKILPQYLRQDLLAGLRKLGRPSVLYGSLELALIEIEWIYSNDRLLKAFAAWLSESRPADVKVQEDKGAGNFLRRRRDDLKALGAWRLLSLQEMTWEKAFLITSNEGKSKGLYSNHPKAWTEAKKRAHGILRHLVAGYASSKPSNPTD